MDDIIKAYKDAYYKANGKHIVIRKHIRIRYTIQGDGREFTENQIKGFTHTLLERISAQADYINKSK